MTLTLSVPSAGERAGPGMWCQVHDDAFGPFPIDDVIEVYLVFGVRIICGGAALAPTNDTNIQLGRGSSPTAGGSWSLYPFTIGLADNTAVTVGTARYHANGTLVQFNNYGGHWNWDAVSQAWALSAGLTADLAALSSKMDQVLLATGVAHHNAP